MLEKEKVKAADRVGEWLACEGCMVFLLVLNEIWLQRIWEGKSEKEASLLSPSVRSS